MAMKFQGRKHDEPTDKHAGQQRRNIVCSGGGAGAGIEVPSNSRPLSDFVEQNSLRSRRVYDWKTGAVENRKLDIVTNAQRNIARTKISTVTSNRRDNKQRDDDDGNGCCYPSVPTIGGRE